MPKRSSKQKDTQQLARSILDAVAPDAEPKSEKEKNPAAVALGRLGGLKGGKLKVGQNDDRMKTVGASVSHPHGTSRYFTAVLAQPVISANCLRDR